MYNPRWDILFRRLSVFRWKRVLRGMLGMGATFAAIGGGFFAAMTAIAAVLGRLEAEDPFFGVAAGAVWGFAIGVAFSAVLAAAGSRVGFEKLSIPRVAAMGAIGGFFLAGALIGLTKLAGNNFTGVVEALTFLPVLGALAGAGSLVVARRSDEPTVPIGRRGDELPDRRAGRERT